jgi:hypothetical protein
VIVTTDGVAAATMPVRSVASTVCFVVAATAAGVADGLGPLGAIAAPADPPPASPMTSAPVVPEAIAAESSETARTDRIRRGPADPDLGSVDGIGSIVAASKGDVNGPGRNGSGTMGADPVMTDAPVAWAYSVYWHQ